MPEERLEDRGGVGRRRGLRRRARSHPRIFYRAVHLPGIFREQLRNAIAPRSLEQRVVLTPAELVENLVLAHERVLGFVRLDVAAEFLRFGLPEGIAIERDLMRFPSLGVCVERFDVWPEVARLRL